MASESVEGPQSGPQAPDNVIQGPWKGLPWRDPQHADFYLVREPEAQMLVKLNAEATKRIWQEYRAFKRDNRAQLIVLGRDGSFIEAVDSHLAKEKAMLSMGVVYNVATRRCWRPVWWPSTPVDTRGLGNVTHESVRIQGWDSFVEGWENRPKAKLFENS